MTALKQPKRYCINCGAEIVGDDGGGWLHKATLREACARTFATPAPEPAA